MKLSKITSLAFAAGMASAAHAGEADLSPKAESVARAVEESLGVKGMVILDKDNAEILVVNQGKVVMRSPALVGIAPGEDERLNPKVTPMGVFPLAEHTVNPREYQGGRVFGFRYTRKGDYWIHPTWYGNPSEQRDQRLATSTPNDNAITNGCVNVPYGFYQAFSNWLKAHPQYFKGSHQASYAPFIVMPKGQDTASTLRLLGLSTSQNRPSDPAPK